MHGTADFVRGSSQKSGRRKELILNMKPLEDVSGTSPQFPLPAPLQKHGTGFLVALMDFKEFRALAVSSEASVK